jgi:hypothetical protein
MIKFVVEFDILGIILWYKQKQKLDREFDTKGLNGGIKPKLILCGCELRSEHAKQHFQMVIPSSSYIAINLVFKIVKL